MLGSSDNRFWHNNINNPIQVRDVFGGSMNLWDDDYPSGGNYWNDYSGVDQKSGLSQNITGSDGIGDTPYVLDANNQDNYPLMESYAGPHDIGIISFTASKTLIGQGYSTVMNAKVLNYGNSIETFTLDIYVNETSYASTSTDVSPGYPNFFGISFYSAGFGYGTYVLRAVAIPVQGETDTTDNNATITIKVTIPGDVNGDFIVDISDAALIGVNWQKTVSSAPANVDINGDGVIDISDAALVGVNWQQHV